MSTQPDEKGFVNAKPGRFQLTVKRISISLKSWITRPMKSSLVMTTTTMIFLLLTLLTGTLNEVAGKWLAVALFVISIPLFLIYRTYRISDALNANFYRHQRLTDYQPPSFHGKQDNSVFNFALALALPKMVTHRISEHVEPLTRALQVDAKHTISLANEKEIVYPAILHNKLILVDSISIESSGVEMPIYSKYKAAELGVQAIDAIVLLAGAATRRYRNSLRKDTFKLFAGLPNEMVLSNEDRNPQLPGAGGIELDDITNRYKSLFSECKHKRNNDVSLSVILSLLETLCYHFCIAVHSKLDSPSTVITAHYRLIQSLNRGNAHNTRSAGLGYIRNLSAVRIATGHRPMRLSYSIDLATRCEDYHLELFGAFGTYLARQQVVGSNKQGDRIEFTVSGQDPHSADKQLRARLGQRYLHLNISNGTNKIREDGMVASCGFVERPPGSIAATAIASGASTALILAGGYIHSHPVHTEGNIIAILLTFPFVVGSFLGLHPSNALLSGGSMVSHLSGALVALLSVIAAITILGYRFEPFVRLMDWMNWLAELSFLGTRGGWAILSLASLAATLILGGSWLIRTSIYFALLRRHADYQHVTD